MTRFLRLSLCLALLWPAAAAEAALRNRYSFTADAVDTAGTAHGTLLGGATVSGGSLLLNGSTAYLDLPNNLVTGYTAITIEVWLVNNGSGNWARIFDFGNNSAGEGNAGTGTQYMFLTPGPGPGVLRGAYTTTGGGAGEQIVQSTTTLPTGVLKHVVWATDGATQLGRLYVDGVLVGSNTAVTLTPAAIGPMNNVWIGRAQFSADAFLNASITEFRIYDTALTPEEISLNLSLGPDTAALAGPVSISTQPQSQTVTELQPVTFSVAYNGNRPVAVQWFRDDAAIPGATNDSYTIPSTALGDDNAAFRVALTNSITNATFIAISSNATLDVTPDLAPPLLQSAYSLYPTQVLVVFSEGVLPLQATDPANYVITNLAGPLAVSAAVIGGGASSVLLSTAPQTLGSSYTLTVNRVRDLANSGNVIATNSQAGFVASDFVTTNIGFPILTGALASAAGGYDLVTGGRGIGGTNDHFTLAYRIFNGDFDVEVRLGSLTLADAWTRAGLMARDGTSSNAAFAASFATPGPAGCFFSSRATAGAVATMAGSFPVNYPDTWLRLRRVGNVFDGFASLDGQTWELLGSSTLPLPATLQVGLALSSGRTNATATAQFREFAVGSGTFTTNAPLPFEPPGPSSRRSALVVSEIMYNPPSTWAGTNNLEFVELWNSGFVTEDLTGFKLRGDLEYNFPNGTVIRPGEYLVIAKNPSSAIAFYGLPTCLGPYTNTLGNNGGRLRLVNELGSRLIDLEYDNKAPWPVAADGTGHSLVLSRASYGENDPRAWAASDLIGGSPGRGEHWGTEPARQIVINEFLANTDGALEDFVELYNAGSSSVNVGGFWLSDEASTNKFRITDNTMIPAHGCLAFTQTQLGFGLSSDGEHIFLVNSNRTRVIDAVQFDAQASGVSRGRYPDGAPGFVELGARTAGTTNAPPLYRPLVLNEIMYNPISGLDDDEYVEIYNRGTSSVALANWQLDGGVQFTFPSNAVIVPNGLVVVGENLTNLLAKYPQLNATNAFGNYSGSLRNSGERITLQMPEISYTTNGQVITTNILRVTINEVTWRDGGRWGQWSDGGGSSLELIDAWADNRFGASWADSDESIKAPWTIIDVTNVLENGQTAAMINQGGYQGPPNRFEFFLQDDGEALFDDLEFRNNGGTSMVSNGNFSGGLTGYTLRGTYRTTYAESGAGFGGSVGLHVVATGRGDTGANKISTPFTTTVVTNAPNTGIIRAKVRWLKGSPYVMLRTRGHWMEVSQRLNLPANLGTPGLLNSRLVANAGPVIADVSHSPVLPAANQSVVVGARIIDVDGVGVPTLRHRIDPATSFSNLPMNDAGTDGDATAGDGVFSATIPGQGAGTLAAFYILAVDQAGPAASSRFPSDAPVHECLVRWGETSIAGNIATYRLWVTSSNLTFWGNRERNANDPIDATFVYGNSRVFYNVKTLYSGSPFHAPSYNGPLGSFSCDYEVNFPADDTLLGSRPFVLAAYDTANTASLFFADTAGQVDITGNWIARKLGQPFNYRRHMHMVMNGQRRGTIYDDNQQPNGEWLEQHFPDDPDGDLRKIEDWFEFADDAQTQGVTTSTVERFNRAAGGIDAKRYRWTWRPRATDDPNNWYALTNLMLAWNDTANPNFINRLDAWVDMPNFLRPIITHHICGDWDSYGYERGKNMYAYKPTGAGWRLLMWDIELALGNRQSRAATDSIYSILDPQLRFVITNTPLVLREYLCGYLEACNGPLLAGAADGLLDERFASFVQNNLPMESPQYIKTFISQRRAYLLSVIPTAPFAVGGTNFLTVSSSNLLTFTGTAPVSVKEILINGAAYPITWTGVTSWTIRVPLAAGTNTLQFAAVDGKGTTLSNATVTVNYTGPAAPPEGSVVLSEIMYRPPVDDADYVELFNNSTNLTFDLSGWRINGLGFTFPGGSLIAPRAQVVVARNQNTFAGTYSASVPVLAEFDGELDNSGETLSLLRPGAMPGEEILVDRVRYEPVRPWAQEANGAGGALQVIDPAQDNSRAGNWASAAEWRYVTATGVANSSRIYVYLNGVGDLFIDDMVLVAGTVPEAGANRLANGGFESPLAGTWTVPTGNQQIHQSTTNTHTGGGSLHLWSTNPAIVLTAILIQDISPALTTGQPYTLSFWFKPKPGTPNLTTRMSSGTLNTTFSTAPTLATPGAANGTVAVLPPFPPLWLNEVLPLNTTGRLDNQGEAEPWFELYNDSTNLVSLEGLYLSTNYASPLQWAFPAGADIAPGQFKVIVADGETNESTLAELHISFRLAGGAGSIVLSRVVNNSPQVVDYLNFSGLGANGSYGDFPDGQPFFRQDFFYTTPAGTNNATAAPIVLFINEWMASNTGFVRDPADMDTDDWFEIYNPNNFPVDLGSHYLTDNLLNRLQYQVPNNGHYVIPAGGYLLVWADSETGQNSTNRPDLHVSFNLAAGGEAIGLSAPDGRLIDSVTFFQQSANVSQGRRPDGSTNIVALPMPSPRAANYQPPVAPVLATPGVSGANVSIMFSSVPGVTYRVQFKDDLSSPMWINLPGDVAATGTVTSKSDTNNLTQRFYQVIALP